MKKKRQQACNESCVQTATYLTNTLKFTPPDWSLPTAKALNTHILHTLLHHSKLKIKDKRKTTFGFAFVHCKCFVLTKCRRKLETHSHRPKSEAKKIKEKPTNIKEIVTVASAFPWCVWALTLLTILQRNGQPTHYKIRISLHHFRFCGWNYSMGKNP